MNRYPFKRLHREILKAAFLSVVLLIAGCTPAEPTQQGKTGDTNVLSATDIQRVTVGTEAPDFTLESSGGNRVKLSDFRGRKNVVLVFYRGYW